LKKTGNMGKEKWKITRIHLGTCLSTQEFLRENLDRYLPDFPICITAGTQTRGHGRRDRFWHSPPGLGLYMTWGFQLQRRKMLHWVPLIAGIAVSETLERSGKVPVQMKWPNDLLVYGHKVAGILSESRVFAEKCVCCCGIGINLNHSVADFPAELREKATSLAIVSAKKHFNPDRFLTRLCGRLIHWHQVLETGSSERIRTAVNLRMRWMVGSRITVHQDHAIIRGTIAGISGDGGLILELSDGKRESFFSGEVH